MPSLSNTKPVFIVTNGLIWMSAAVVMGIYAYFVSLGVNVGALEKMTLAISAITVATFLASFLLDAAAGTVLLFNTVFSILWIILVVDNHGAFVHHQHSVLGPVAAAFCYITFFLIFFNILYDWNLRFRGGAGRIALGTSNDD